LPVLTVFAGPNGSGKSSIINPLPHQFDVVIERDAEGYYVASVPQIRGCHTQARSLDEAAERIREAISLCLEVDGTPRAWQQRKG